MIIIILQSKKFTEEDGSFHFKNKIYLYKEDFSAFAEIIYVLNHKGEEVISERHQNFKKRIRY
jgi:hypothetical protein